MKKVFLAIAVLATFGATAPAMACEGGKCTMNHEKQDGSKTKKGKKAAAKEESCHMASASKDKTKSCCAKPAAEKVETKKN